MRNKIFAKRNVAAGEDPTVSPDSIPPTSGDEKSEEKCSSPPSDDCNSDEQETAPDVEIPGVRFSRYVKTSIDTNSSSYNFIKEHDWIVNWIESGILYAHECFRARQYSDFVIATVKLIKMVSNGSLIMSIMDSPYFKTLLLLVKNSFVEQSLEEDVDSARSGLNFFEKFRNSALYKKVYKLLMYILSFPILDRLGITFDTFGYTSFEAELIKKKYTSCIDFGYAIFDSIIFLLERGIQILRTGKLSAIVHSGKNYSEWYEMAEKLKRQSSLMSNPSVHGLDEFTYRSELDSAIEQGTSIHTVATGLDLYDRKIVKAILNDLMMIRYELTTKNAAREPRTPPFSVLVYGDSGIGKSTIKDMLYFHYAKVMGLNHDMCHCYVRNPAAKFWDGFSTSMWCIILDDVAFMHPNKAPNGDPSVMEFLQIINSVPFCPDQADLADKGRTPLRAKLCIGTTNTQDLNAHYYFANASAAQRRFPFIIHPSVKREYISPDNMLDPSKVPQSSGYPDLWNWKVIKVIPVSISSGKKVADTTVILETSNVNEFITWYSQAIKDFEKNQTIVEDSHTALRDLKICDVCYLPDCMCSEQSSAVPICAFMIGWFVNFLFVLLYRDIFNILYVCTGWKIFRNLDIYLRAFILANHFRAWYNYRLRRMRLLGNNVQQQHISATGVAILSGVVLLYALYRTFRSAKEILAEQGATDSRGSPPRANSTERKDVWYRDEMEFSTYNLTSTTLSSNGISENQIMDLLGFNCADINFVCDPKNFNPGKMSCLSGHTYITNNHIIGECKQPRILSIVFQSAKNGVNENLRIPIEESMVTRFPEWDICLLRLRAMPPKRGIYRYLPKTFIDVRHNGFYLSRDKHGSMGQNPIHKIVSGSQHKLKPTYKHTYLRGLADRKTVNGDCGSLMVLHTPRGYVVAGMHHLGNELGNDVFSIPLAQEIFSTYFESNPEVQGGTIHLSSKSAERHIVQLHKKATVRYVQNGTAAILGSFTGFRMQSKSRVSVTPMSHYLSTHGYRIKFGKPEMSSWEPWRIALLDSVVPSERINPCILNMATDGYITDILKELTAEHLSTIHVYDDFTAINGAEGIAYVDKMNRKTSAGNPWKKSKQYFMEACAAERGLNDPVVVDDEIMERAGNIIDLYESGSRAYPNFCAHLKDEATEFRKVKAKKTRVFTGAPFDFSIVVRKYLLSVVRVIQNNKLIFEAGPGTVAQSIEWQYLYEYITKFGEDRIAAGDFKAFDKRISPLFMMAAFDVLIALCESSGNYTASDLAVLRGIAVDTSYPLVDFRGDLIMFYGSNPSGHPLTVIINSIVNSLYMRYAYALANPKGECSSFRENVALFTYGDDNIMSISPNVPWFSHTTISAGLATIDITYTMADKLAQSVPYININDASFLKRKWRHDPDVGALLAPLEHDSIEKQLMVWVRSSSVSKEEQMIAIISTVIREYFYYGRDIFEEKRELLRRMIKDLNIQDWMEQTTLPTWDTLYDDFWTHSRLILPSIDDPKYERVCASHPTRKQKGSLFIDTANLKITPPSKKVGEWISEEKAPGRSPKSLFREGSRFFPNDEGGGRDYMSQKSPDYTGLTEQKPCVGQSSHSEPDASKRARSDSNATTPTLKLVQQSETDMLQNAISENTTTTDQENVGFHDSSPGEVMEIPATVDYVMSQSAVNGELKDYLSRPVLIYTKNWTEGTLLDPSVDVFSPWEDYFSQSAIKRKLDNYFLVQCNLHLKVVINASPFYYGAGMVSYQPLTNLNPAPIVIAGGLEYNVPYSQRPHIKFYPQTSEGGELVLPFLFYKEWLNATSLSEIRNMGQCTLSSFTQLYNANNTAGQDCTIQVYAWAENVRLAGPTLKLAVQSKSKKMPKNNGDNDEYSHEGTVSKPASSIARAAGMMSSVPIIGPFMTATSVAADAVSSIASLFGYTDVPVIDDVHMFKSNPLPQLAATDIGIPTEKLTLDSKNELSVDPKICGVDLNDELMISSFCQRESFLGKFTWTSTRVAGDHLFSARVTPQIQTTAILPNEVVHYKTPMGYIAECFRHWRGDMKFRFKVIASQYHRGRIKISWDPIGDISLNPSATTEIYSKIVDITECNDILINVPYTQGVAYQETTGNTNQGWLTTGFPTFSTVNGQICVSVVTNQTSPVASAPIEIAVFVSAGDNMEFANPQEIDPRLSPYAVQSEPVLIEQSESLSYTNDDSDIIELGGHKSTTDSNINLVYMGEHIVSLRQLFRRTSLHSYMPNPSTYSPANKATVVAHTIARKPRYPGFDGDGTDQATGLTSGTLHPYNWVNWHYMSFLQLCFVGVRGSINWVANTHSQINMNHVQIGRNTNRVLTQVGYYETTNALTQNSEKRLLTTAAGRPGGLSGLAATNQQTQTTVHASVPMYARYKFQTNSSLYRTLGTTDDDSNEDSVTIIVVHHPSSEGDNTNSGVDLYCSAGTDFNLIFFLNVPCLFRYASIPNGF